MLGALAQLFLLARFPETLPVGTQWPSRLGFALLLGAVALRAAAAGTVWVPGLGLGESLLLLTCASAGSVAFFESRFARARGTLVFSMLACAGLAWVAYRTIGWRGATLSVPESASEAIEFGSRWIYPHVLAGMVAYGLIVTAAGFGLMQLIQDRVSSDSLMGGATFAAASLLTLLIASETPSAPGFPIRVLAATLAVHAGLSLFSFRILRKLKPWPAKFLGAAGENLSIWQRLIRLIYLANGFALIVFAFLFRNSGPVLLVLACAVGGVWLVWILARYRHLFEAGLPAVDSWLFDSVDHWSLKSSRAAVVALSTTLITGSLLARGTWGRFWGWDPKETLTLVLLIHFLLTSLLREQPGVTRRQAGILALSGLFLAAWVYFGANLVFPHLHAYGSPR